MSEHPTDDDDSHPITFLEWLDYWGPERAAQSENPEKHYKRAWPAGPLRRRREHSHPDGPDVA